MQPKFFEKVRELKLPKGSYAIFGSGPLEVRGIRESKDIDIIVKKDVWNSLVKNMVLREIIF